MTVVYLKIAWPEGVVHTRRMMIGMFTGRNIIYIILLHSVLQNNKEKKYRDNIKKTAAQYTLLQYLIYIYNVYEHFDDPNFFYRYFAKNHHSI